MWHWQRLNLKQNKNPDQEPHQYGHLIYSKVDTEIQTGKLLWINGAGLDRHTGKKR